MNFDDKKKTGIFQKFTNTVDRVTDKVEDANQISANFYNSSVNFREASESMKVTSENIKEGLNTLAYSILFSTIIFCTVQFIKILKKY